MIKKRFITVIMTLLLFSVAATAFSVSALDLPQIPAIKDSACNLKIIAPASAKANDKFILKIVFSEFSESAKKGLEAADFKLSFDDTLFTAGNSKLTLSGKDVPIFATIRQKNGHISYVIDLMTEPAKTSDSLIIEVPFTVNASAVTATTAPFFLKDVNIVTTSTEGTADQTPAKVTILAEGSEMASLNGIEYIIDTAKGTAMVAGVSNSAVTSVAIPRSFTYSSKTYAVTSIGDGAFANLSALTSAKIPCSVTSIVDSAFKSGQTNIKILGCAKSAAEKFANAKKFTFEIDTSEYKSEVVTQATCKENGSTKYSCKNCDSSVTKKDIPKTTDHKFGEWIIVKEATDVSEGQRKRVCSVCGEEVFETIPKLNPDCKHKTTKEVIEKEATCTEKGKINVVCVLCSKIISTKETPMKPHKFSEWIVLKKPTTTQTGLEERTCSVCGKKETRAIDKITTDCKHTKTANKHLDATCTKDGYDRTVCSECGKVLSSTTIKAAHKQGPLETKDATCTEDGYKIQKCTACGEFMVNEVVPAKGHTFSEWEIIVQATETSEGVKKRVCSVCGHTEVEPIPKLGNTSEPDLSVPAVDSSSGSTNISTPIISQPESGVDEGGGGSNKTIFFVIGGVVIMLTVGYVVIMAINKKKNF